LIPTKFFLTRGAGRAKQNLAAFEEALRDAGIQRQNIVTVSSILPPGCKQISKDEGVKLLNTGEITYVILARNETNEARRLVAASIGIAIPAEIGQYGYLSEVHLAGRTDEEAGEYAEDLAASMLATTLGISFDVNTSWDSREQVYKASGRIIKTANITQSAIYGKDECVTVIAAAVLLP
jgi:arginine decarboxylase